MEQIDVLGLRVAYERAGKGPPLVLAHGYVGDGWSTWHRQLEELSDEFTVLAWDAPGTGRSSDPPEAFGMAGFADCLAAFIEGVGFGQAHVGGLSFGGALALELCRRHPQVPSTLILASAYAGWGGSLPAEEVTRRLEQALRLSELPPRALVDALLPSMFSAAAPPSDVDLFRASMAAFHPVGVRAMARALAEDLRGVLPGMTVPTLLVSGSLDQRAPLHVAEDLRRSIPTATLVVLPDAGHVCSIDAAEQFNRQLRTFLRNHPI